MLEVFVQPRSQRQQLSNEILWAGLAVTPGENTVIQVIEGE